MHEIFILLPIVWLAGFSICPHVYIHLESTLRLGTSHIQVLRARGLIQYCTCTYVLAPTGLDEALNGLDLCILALILQD
ncbi:hypothetical protein F4781DRAFT_380948 [Annulohypoxylon bovei var. microspora]|nr:hypothetical protein F4781DRAFT_380948 [Annulohypoxylon bovei var. microspora]